MKNSASFRIILGVIAMFFLGPFPYTFADDQIKRVGDSLGRLYGVISGDELQTQICSEQRVDSADTFMTAHEMWAKRNENVIRSVTALWQTIVGLETATKGASLLSEGFARQEERFKKNMLVQDEVALSGQCSTLLAFLTPPNGQLEQVMAQDLAIVFPKGVPSGPVELNK